MSVEEAVLMAAITEERRCMAVTTSGVMVTPFYLRTMFAFVARYGWFIDTLVATGEDHEFNYIEITPGHHWGKVRILRNLAAEEAAVACMFERAGMAGQAKAHKLRADELSQEIERWLSQDPNFEQGRWSR
jgi:hypothetical protein